MSAFIFRQIDAETSKPFVERWHYGPMPANPEFCFGAFKGDELIAVSVFSKMKNHITNSLLEFISHAKSPDTDLQMSQFIKYCCKQLRNMKYDLLATFCDAEKGDGAVFRGATWIYDGRRNWSSTEYRLDARPNIEGRYHIYWRALSEFGDIYARELGLRRTPYPRVRQKMIA